MWMQDWIKALQLPNKITSAVLGACVVLLLFDDWGVVDLNKVSEAAWTIVVIVAVFSACLFLISLLAQYGPKGFLLAKMKWASRSEKAHQKSVLSELDALTDDEISVVAEAALDNRRRFEMAKHDQVCFQLCDKGVLIHSTNSAMPVRGYLFEFPYFVWEELTRRGAEFLEKDKFRRYDLRGKRIGQRLR